MTNINVKPLISINAFSKARLKEMILNLIPGVGYVRIRKDGIVILKENWYSFKRTKLHVSDLCESELPRQISNKATRNGLGTGYERIFNEYITEAKHLKYWIDSFDIVDYLWDKYIKLCINLPILYVGTETGLKPMITEGITTGKHLPVISPHSLNWGYVLSLAKDITDVNFDEINKKINEILGNNRS